MLHHAITLAVTAGCVWKAVRAENEERAAYAAGSVCFPVGHISAHLGEPAISLAAMALMAVALGWCAVRRRRRRASHAPSGS